MVLDDNTNGEYLDLEGQIQLIKLAEWRYMHSDRWLTLTGRNYEFAPIQHPYMDFASVAGEQILMDYVKPEHFSEERTQDTEDLVDIIMGGKGGTETLDTEFEIGLLRFISEYLPIEEKVKISKEAWEKRCVEYVIDTLEIIERALNIPDQVYDDELIGLTKDELLNLSAFSQSYALAKTKGLQTVEENFKQLMEGHVIYFDI